MAADEIASVPYFFVERLKFSRRRSPLRSHYHIKFISQRTGSVNSNGVKGKVIFHGRGVEAKLVINGNEPRNFNESYKWSLKQSCDQGHARYLCVLPIHRGGGSLIIANIRLNTIATIRKFVSSVIQTDRCTDEKLGHSFIEIPREIEEGRKR